MSANTAEVIPVAPDVGGVSCDGGGGALGHPKVWYIFEDHPSVTCGYCGRVFVRRNESPPVSG